MARSYNSENMRIVLGLLQSLERNGAQSQRMIATELGVALGLVNAYLKRCINKGLVKIGEAPPRRFAYYLTPQGFSEKSRLTLEYLSSSFSFFRTARADCLEVIEAARARGWHRIALLGISDLAEIAIICAAEANVTVVAVVDSGPSPRRFVGCPVYSSIELIDGPIDAVLVTDLKSPRATAGDAVVGLGRDRVLLPSLLGVRLVENDGVVQ